MKLYLSRLAGRALMTQRSSFGALLPPPSHEMTDRCLFPLQPISALPGLAAAVVLRALQPAD